MCALIFILTLGLASLTSSAGVPFAPINGISSGISAPLRLSLREGSIAYEDSNGIGPILLCIPGIGDTRGQYRFIAPLLKSAGFRVVTVDPRGQGDSDATFSSYSASAIGDDITQLIDHLDGTVVLIGNSAGGASAAWIAANRQNRIKGLVLIDAFLRDHPIGVFTKTVLNIGMSGPWASLFWLTYYKSLFITNPPPDQKTVHRLPLARSLALPRSYERF